ncbi:hypothetical protein [Pseudonocardia zijingensis]|jgi:hypothetical protein|uniref:Uncharacterized protein n=1 Tax=Pseudonocardia zijingensis TaxID=153376 RepID=A0ABN1PSU3_9PSEU
MELVVLDRDDGTRRRSFDCPRLHQGDSSSDGLVFPAPGALVLVDKKSLAGITG